MRAGGVPTPPRVVYEDDWIVVVDKPSGLAVHAAQGAPGPDLLALVRDGRGPVALLHRLDRGASGLVLFGKRPEANAPLQRQLEAHAVERVYVALLAGRLPDGERVVDRPVAERAGGRRAIRRRPDPGARGARTKLRTLRRVGGATLVEALLETGRKHQIRIHAASIGHPIVGDRRYGGPPAARLALHAARLGLLHPGTGARLELEAPIPDDLAAMIATADRAGRG